MLTIKNLSLYQSKDLRMLLEDFSFSLHPGEKFALIGEEGNGKSSLLKAIVVPEKLKEYMEVRGEISVTGEIIGYLPQMPDEDVLQMATGAYLRSRIPSEETDYARYYRLLSEMELSEELISENLTVGSLSGGEKIKFLLFVERMKNPTVLLLDEPTNDLDLRSVQWFEHFLREIDLPVMFISHDELLLERCATGIIHLEQLRRKSRPQHTVARQGYLEYRDGRESRIEKQSQLAVKEKEIFDAKMTRYRRVHDRVEHELRSEKGASTGKNLKDKMHTVKAMGRRFEKERANLTRRPDFEEAVHVLFDENILLKKGVRPVDFRLEELRAGDRILSKNLELQVFGGEKVAIVGANGAGKTTFLKKILHDLRSQNVRIGYMPQNYEDEFPEDRTAVDFLAKDSSKDERTKARTVLGSMNFTVEEMFHPVRELSGGQQAKLYFINMILDRAELLLLDEPTRNLSPLSAPEIRQALRQFGGSILAVSHDRKLLVDVFDRILELTPIGLADITEKFTNM